MLASLLTRPPSLHTARLWFVLASLTCCTLLACGPRHKSDFGAGLPTVRASAEESSLERAMFERLNADRKKKGLAPLAYDDRLADIARYHSRDMRDAGFFGHDSPTTGSPQDRVDRAGYLALESRENVAQAPDVATAQDQLLASPGHYANIMADTVTHVGIGVVRDKEVPGQVRGYYFTQLFAKPVTSVSKSEARDVVMQKVTRARREAGLPPLPMHPLLERLAKAHVQDVDPDAPARTLDRIGDAVVKELSQEGGEGLRGVEAAAQVGLGAQMLQPERLMDGGVRAIGFALAEDQDKQGKPVLKMLFLVGR